MKNERNTALRGQKARRKINSGRTEKSLLCAVLSGVMMSAAFAPLSVAADCEGLPSHKELKAELTRARKESNGGLNLDMWGTVVNRDGEICAVTYTGADRSAQWPASRAISAQKAYTANSLSLPQLALSTANLFAAVQPGAPLYGLQESSPVDAEEIYEGPAEDYGTAEDPMVGNTVGGINVFGGGVALYNKDGKLVGGLGVSGDTSCADHNIAWRTRKNLQLDYVPAGVSPAKDDNIMYAQSKEALVGFTHPPCGNTEDKVELPPVAKRVTNEGPK